MAKHTGARSVALELLISVDVTHAYANLTLPRLLGSTRLSIRDRALATELSYGTLRAQGTLDHILAPHLSRPLAGLDPEVRGALRLGVYQLWRTRVPPHAAVGQTVELVPVRARGFVNAVLRKISVQLEGPDPLGLAAVTDPLDRLAVETSHPRWIVEAFLDALGGDLAQTQVALAADDGRPTVHLAAVPGRLTADELAVESGGRTGALSPYAVYLDDGGDPGALASVRSGAARAQDEGSQLCALALHRALAPTGAAAGTSFADDLLPGAQHVGVVIDLAAGPGGKAVLLSALESGRRAVIGLELHHHRARLVRSAGLPSVVVGDGMQPPFKPGCAEAVLVDAPCTGLGALRRRPEARWRRQAGDLDALVPLQRALLESALRLVRPGGLVAYVVCSPHLAEAVVPPDVLGRDDVEVVDAPALLDLGAGARAPDTEGLRLQLWPHRHGTDAMSLTLLRRRDSR